MNILTQGTGDSPADRAAEKLAEGGAFAHRQAGESKRCQGCGATLECFARCAGTQEAGCWCSKIKLDGAALARLRAEYEDCLCEACLLKAAGADR